MMCRPDSDSKSAGWPAWWRAAIIVASTLVLCSCRVPPVAEQPLDLSRDALGLSPSAWADEPPDVVAVEYANHSPYPPLPYQIGGDWSPDGLARPWPADEYLRDGGDRGLGVRVTPNWKVLGLDVEDAVAHYDTLDGQTVVEPSNRVHIYAPRFAAVRTVSGLVQGEGRMTASGLHRPKPPVINEDVQIATTTLQRIQAEAEIGDRLPILMRARQQDGALSTALVPGGFHDAFLPFENLRVIRNGIYRQAEKARLAEAVEAAITWSHDKAVQVVIDNKQAVSATSHQRGEAIFTVEDRRRPAKLRVLKVASPQLAQPGDTIDFTIRFDNIGGQPIGNVTIIDNLTTRLDYVADSAQCSLAANFSVERNEVDSLVLRWEVVEPLEAGEGGIVRFNCRVR